MKAEYVVTGIEDTLTALTMGANEIDNAVRASVHAVAAAVAKDMKAGAPTDQRVLRNSIKAKRRRRKPQETVYVSDVRVTEGRKARYDAWYWHFVEYGTAHQRGANFIEPAKLRGRQEYERSLNSAFKKRLDKLRRKVK